MKMAITTRYFGPGNVRGSRIKAVARKREEDWQAGKLNRVWPALALTDDYADEMGVDENHCRVAHLLAAKLGWSGLYVGGVTPDGYVFVNCADVLPGYESPTGGSAGREWFYVAPRTA